MTPTPLPPLEYLQEALEICLYSPSGLRWKKRPRYHFNTNRGHKISNTKHFKKQAGGIGKSGDGDLRYMVKINQSRFCCHRVVFALNYNKDPWPNEIDHIDGNSINNRPENLRIATRSENACNKARPQNNTSGRIGVTFCKRTQMWMAQIGLNGKNIFLGRYNKIENAMLAREQAEQKHHGVFSGNICRF